MFEAIEFGFETKHSAKHFDKEASHSLLFGGISKGLLRYFCK
jgi:hypothetical protein